MKKYILLFAVCIVLAFSLISQTNCLLPEYEDNCSGLVSSIFDDYIYLRSRAFSSEKSNDVMFSISLKRNILYVFNVCESNGKDNMVISLYDSKDKMVASSVNPKTKKNTKILIFKPDEPGKFYISASFSKKEPSCCLILFGMITKNIEQYISTSKK